MSADTDVKIRTVGDLVAALKRMEERAHRFDAVRAVTDRILAIRIDYVKSGVLPQDIPPVVLTCKEWDALNSMFLIVCREAKIEAPLVDMIYGVRVTCAGRAPQP